MAFLLDDLLLSPIHMLAWMAERVKEAAESEMSDDSAARGDLLEFEMRLEAGEISEEEYLKKAREVMERLQCP